MILTILLAGTQLPAAPPADLKTRGASPNAVECVQTRAHQAERNGDKRPDRLIDQPPGGLYLTVVRRIGQCQIPTLVRDGYGAAGNGPRRR
jgi:hypothetical protein